MSGGGGGDSTHLGSMSRLTQVQLCGLGLALGLLLRQVRVGPFAHRVCVKCRGSL